MRVAFNEAASRAGNERLHGFEERQEDPPSTRHWFMCECGDGDCKGRLSLTRAEYEILRSDEMRYAVLVGHVFPDLERVVSEHDGYLVVEKDEAVRAIVDRRWGPRTLPRVSDVLDGATDHGRRDVADSERDDR